MTDPEDTVPPLPTEADFVPCGDCLDAQDAWKHFGGLSVDQAYARFCENPGYYQEDFMFMGGVAFSYYFPVIERHVRDPRLDDYLEDQLCILAHCIRHQFMAPEDRPHVEPLRERVLQLALYVRNNLSQYCDDEDRHILDSAWSQLMTTVTTPVSRSDH